MFDALTSGDLDTAQVEAISDARVPETVRAEFVADAVSQHTDQTWHRVREAENQHDTDSAAQRAKRQRAARGAGWGRDHQGMLKLWARFDPETGAHIEATLEQLRRSYWNRDKQQRTDRRTPAQRDADALAYALAGITHTDTDAQAVADLLARTRPTPNNQPGPALPEAAQPAGTDPAQPHTPHARSTQPNRTKAGSAQPDTPHARSTQPNRTEIDLMLPGCATPGVLADRPAGTDELPDQTRWLPPAQINVLITLETLRGQTDQTGITDAGTELAPETVRKLACDAEIIPIILGGAGGSADIGRARRTVPPRLRRLLIARDRHCKWPGCKAPPSRCDAHHIIHWAANGPTNLANLLLLCHTHHHHHLHEHGYQLIPDHNGNWTPTRQPDNPPPASRRTDNRRTDEPTTDEPTTDKPQPATPEHHEPTPGATGPDEGGEPLSCTVSDFVNCTAPDLVNCTTPDLVNCTAPDLEQGLLVRLMRPSCCRRGSGGACRFVLTTA